MERNWIRRKRKVNINEKIEKMLQIERKRNRVNIGQYLQNDSTFIQLIT